jgi:hypothetical protein
MAPASTTAPFFVVDGPLPRPPKYRLLDVATIIEEPDPHVQAGVSVWSYPSDVPTSWDPCSTGTFRSKVTGGAIALPDFGAFAVYITETCSPRSIFTGKFDGETDEAYQRRMQDRFVERAMRVFNATESYAVEREFAKAFAVNSNPAALDANCAVLAAGVAQIPKVGLSYLANALGATGRDGIIHATPAIVTAWGQFRSFRGDDDLLYTVEGTPIAEGTGYIGLSPGVHAAPAAGQDWAFVTGPVDIRRSEAIIYPGNLYQALDRSQNTVEYRVERVYTVDWDTVLQSAVLIDWTSTST